MNNLQGIIARSVNNASMQFENLGYLTTNISNLNTNAYKGVRFENYLKEDGRIEGTLRYNHARGALFNTQRPLDIAIDGAGFIPVTMKNGETAYTRDGSFQVNQDGFLCTADGAVVADGIKIPINYSKIIFDKNGDISIMKNIADKPEKIGKLPLVTFLNPEGLKPLDGNMVAATEDSGSPELMKTHDFIRQGKIEQSNVDIHATINDVLKLNAGMIASTRMIKVVDDMYTKAINLRQ